MFAKLYTVDEEVDFEDEKETSLQIIWIFRVRPFYKITLWKLPEKITFHIDYWDFRKLNLRWLRFFCKIVHCGVVGEEVEDEEEEETIAVLAVVAAVVLAEELKMLQGFIK